MPVAIPLIALAVTTAVSAASSAKAQDQSRKNTNKAIDAQKEIAAQLADTDVNDLWKDVQTLQAQAENKSKKITDLKTTLSATQARAAAAAEAGSGPSPLALGGILAALVAVWWFWFRKK